MNDPSKGYDEDVLFGEMEFEKSFDPHLNLNPL